MDHYVNASPIGPPVPNATRKTTGNSVVSAKNHQPADLAQTTVSIVIQNTTTVPKTQQDKP